MRKLSEIPVIGPFIKSIDHDVQKYGFQLAMKNLIKKTSAKINVYGKNRKLKYILKNKPVVVIANHPNDADAIVLVSTMPVRENSYLVINYKVVGIVPHLSKYLISVYIDHHKHPQTYNPLMAFLLQKFNTRPPVSKNTAHQKNIINIKDASKKISDGGLVIIFPERRSTNKEWFSGVGHLLKQVKNKEDIYIVKAFIKGTSSFDYLRIFPFFSRILPSVSIYYDKPITLNKIWSPDPKQITKTLEKNFKDWSESLHT